MGVGFKGPPVYIISMIFLCEFSICLYMVTDILYDVVTYIWLLIY